MRIKTLLCVIPFFVSALSPMAHAQDAGDTGLPPVRLMSCQGQCANFVEAKPRFRDMPRFSSTVIGVSRQFPESIVRLLYTVGPDGKVRDDILVLNLLGSRVFAERAMEKVRTWSFEPATSGGKPVAQSRMQQFTLNVVPGDFLNQIPTPIEVLGVLRDSPALIEQGKTEEARARLESVLRNAPLSFADRVAIVSPLAEMAFQRGDYLEARRLALIATMSSFKKERDAWLTRIKADLMLGDVSGAQYAFVSAQHQIGTFARDSALPKLLTTARTNADAAPVLTVQAQIPALEEGDVYTFLPYRRSFTFQKIEGSLQKFVLACNQATMESDITTTAQWRIPNSWDGCSLYVRGTPGTKFLVVQPKD